MAVNGKTGTQTGFLALNLTLVPQSTSPMYLATWIKEGLG